MEAQLVPGERLTAHQMVRESLRRAILDGTLTAGERLVQADIAARLRVSTTPVREALRDLAAEGLIRLDAHRGAVVRETSLDEVREIYLIRSLLEPEAVRRAVSAMAPEVVDALRRLQSEMDITRDPARWATLDRNFHRTLVGASGLDRLADILHHLDDNATRYLTMTLPSAHREAGNRDHHRLIEACADRDADRAAKLVHDWLDRMLSTLEDQVAGTRARGRA